MTVNLSIDNRFIKVVFIALFHEANATWITVTVVYCVSLLILGTVGESHTMCKYMNCLCVWLPWQVAVEEQLNSTLEALDVELTWIPDVEKRLGSQQPFMEQARQLAQQELGHKVSS